MLYIQGPIEELNVTEALPDTIDVGGGRLMLEITGTGWVKVNDEKVWITSQAKFLRSDGTNEPVDLSALKVGQEIGVYVPHQWYSQTRFPVAMFVVPAPGDDPWCRRCGLCHLPEPDLSGRADHALHGLQGGLSHDMLAVQRRLRRLRVLAGAANRAVERPGNPDGLLGQRREGMSLLQADHPGCSHAVQILRRDIQLPGAGERRRVSTTYPC